MSTTLLSDIIDLNDPTNESEGRSYSNIPYTNIPEYNNYTQQHNINQQKSVYAPPPPTYNHDIITHDNNSYSIQKNTTPIIPVTPIKNIHNPYNENRSHHIIHDNITHGTNLTNRDDDNVKELTDKYEELCQICKKVNDNNNMVHAIYITMIATLSIILLLVIKKLMNS